MKKSDLRKVRYCTVLNRSYADGLFHEWAQCGDQEHGLEKFALVESKDGQIYEVSTNDIVFIS